MNDLAHVLGNAESLLATSTKMGPMLVAMGKLSPKDLSMILAVQKKHGLRFGEAALKLGLVKAEDIDTILAEQFAYTRPPAASSKLDRRLSALFQPDGIQAEALRSLRSELMLRYFNPQPHRALALVSAEDAYGSALTAANLAITFAQLGLRTLLIDSNLRAPQLNKLFELHEHAPGLSDWLAERTSVAPTAIEAVRCLSVLPAGTRAPNPQELLASKHYQERIGALTLRFDVTLISTAPMDSNRDAQLVAAQAGAALLLARAHITHTKSLLTISNRLRELGVRLVGASLHG
ncbi:MAG: polysaccharide biosynthesis tyrosine autokinase [Cellvibrio sp.]|jgi:chain length determinant protein tyrosine kinase EpsG|nr:polysaccharide biosynthesis tyrosine autokinase [Cellvibrio sp.]